MSHIDGGGKRGVGNYFKPVNLSIALLGFSSGLPILMTLSTLTFWLKQYGVTKETIGMATLLGLPYAFKWLWAPLLDLYRLPLFARAGRRKGWILFFQLIIALIFLSLSSIDPLQSPYLVGSLIFLLAVSSASQDIVVDAFRIDYLNSEEQIYGASTYQMSYRIAMIVMGAGVLALSDFMAWPDIFLLITLLFFTIFALTLLIREPKIEGLDLLEVNTPKEALYQFGAALTQFFRGHRYALLILLFIVAFKLPDAIAGTMINAFYIEMEYTGAQIGAISKLYGAVATILGAFVAGLVVAKMKLYRALIFSAVMIGITNLSYLYVLAEPTLLRLVIAISVENFISGFASTPFIFLLGLLCDRNASATQFALLSGFAAVGLRLFGGGSGFMVEALGWQNFFITTAFLFIPSLLLLFFIKGSINGLEEARAES